MNHAVDYLQKLNKSVETDINSTLDYFMNKETRTLFLLTTQASPIVVLVPLTHMPLSLKTAVRMDLETMETTTTRSQRNKAANLLQGLR